MLRNTMLTIGAGVLALAAASHTLTAGGTPLGSSFTYQGFLESGGEAVAEDVDLRFRAFDASVAGFQVGPQLEALAVPVTDGVLMVDLDFGAIFNGTERWLEIDVRLTSAGGVYTTLAPRQLISAAPIALFALDGNEGPEGPQGPQCDPGAPGADGADGAQGLQGPQGTRRPRPRKRPLGSPARERALDTADGWPVGSRHREEPPCPSRLDSPPSRSPGGSPSPPPLRPPLRRRRSNGPSPTC